MRVENVEKVEMRKNFGFFIVSPKSRELVFVFLFYNMFGEFSVFLSLLKSVLSVYIYMFLGLVLYVWWFYWPSKQLCKLNDIPSYSAYVLWWKPGFTFLLQFYSLSRKQTIAIDMKSSMVYCYYIARCWLLKKKSWIVGCFGDKWLLRPISLLGWMCYRSFGDRLLFSLKFKKKTKHL